MQARLLWLLLCCLPAPALQGSIVGGEEAGVGELPWQVSTNTAC